MRTLPFVLFLGLILWSPTALPGFPPQADSTNITTSDSHFRIQDYIPGEFSTRLRYMRLSTSDREITTRSEYDAEASRYANASLSYRSEYYRESPRLITKYSLTAAASGYLQRGSFSYDPDKLPNEDYLVVSDGIRRSRSLDPRIDLAGSRKQYSARNWFLEGQAACRTGYRLHKRVEDLRRYDSRPTSYEEYRLYIQERDADDESTQTEFSGSGELLLGIGRGRVYNGTTTWWAAEILEIVANLHGINPARISSADYSQLAEILYELELRKFPTLEAPRLRDYERTERVIRQLQAILGPAAGSPATAAVVHDIVRYYPSITRKHGKEWSFHIGASGYWKDRKQDSQQEYDDRQYWDHMADSSLYRHNQVRYDRMSDDQESQFLPTVSLGYSRYRPLSLKWQFNANVELSVVWNEYYERYRSEYERTTTDLLDDTSYVSESITSHKQYQPAHRNADYGLEAQIEVFYIRSSRIWWSFTTESRLRTNHSGRLGRLSGGIPNPEPDYVYLYLLDSEVAYHRQVTWGLYLEGKLAFLLPRIKLLTESGAIDLEEWGSNVRGSISLSYYF
jgi:hypothetical protein